MWRRGAVLIENESSVFQKLRYVMQPALDAPVSDLAGAAGTCVEHDGR